jgi:hypothetical protein
LRGSALAAAAAGLLLAGAAPPPAGAPGAPRVGRADLVYAPSFTTAAGRTARRRGILDGTVEGRFGPGGSLMTAAFVRLEVTSRWPLAGGSDVRANSGYLIHLVAPEEAASGARVSARIRMGDSSYRLLPPRETAREVLGAADASLAERLPDLPALSAMDLDGDGTDEIVAFFRRRLAMSARPEGRMHVFRVQGRAVVDALSVPFLFPDVTDDFDFWGYLVGELTFEPGSPGRPPEVSAAFARTAAAEDQRTDAAPPREHPARRYTIPPP